MTFDLTQRAWVPVLGDRAVREVSLNGALGGAGGIPGLAATPVSMSPALLRYLLAVVLDVFGAPRSRGEWEERWAAGHLDAGRLNAYFDQHRHRFDLFSETAPFAQVADLRTPKDETKPASLLLPAAASGNNVPVFSARTEADSVALSPAEAARWLIHALAWDPAGIKSGAEGDAKAPKGKTYGNPVGPLGQIGVVMPVGRNLFETIMLNLPVLEDGLVPADAPHWRREPMGPTWESREPTGLLDLLTWPSRRVRLIPEDVDGRTVVRSVVLTAGDRMLSIPRDEPHTLWNATRNPKPDDPPWRPRRHQSGKASWQGLDALLAISDEALDSPNVRSSTLLGQIAGLEADNRIDATYPMNVEIVGYEYGSNSAVFDNLVADTLALPIVALRSNSELRYMLDQIVDEADDLITAVNLLDADLRQAAGGDPTPWNSGQRPGTVLVHRLDPVVRRLLRGLQADPEAIDGARDAWHHHAWRLTRRLGDELLASIGPTAFTGRRVTRVGKTGVVRASSAESSFRWRVNKAVGRDGRGNPIPSTEEAS